MKSARNNALKNWRKLVDVRPELSAIEDATLPDKFSTFILKIIHHMMYINLFLKRF